MPDTLKGRFAEVDVLRGLAVTMMVIYHLAFDLDYFGLSRIELGSGLWFFFGRATAALFLLLVGLSLTLSYSRTIKSDKSNLFRKFARRGLWLFSLGMGITLATYLLLDSGFIIFGALHLIGVSIILAYPFLRLGKWNLFLGILVILVGCYLQTRSYPFPWLLWVGLVPAGFYSLDYQPLFPWFGAVLLGIFLGGSLYRDCRRRFDPPVWLSFQLAGPLEFLGRNSLLVYLIHQPILIALLTLTGCVSLPF